jgi:hypothetical protein
MITLSTKILNRNELDEPVEIVSKIDPPTETSRHETTVCHRKGSRIRLVTGHGFPTLEEIGGCHYCFCVTSRAQNGKAYYMTSGEFDSYRNHPYSNYVCDGCKPKIEKARKMQAQIEELEKQLRELDGI